MKNYEAFLRIKAKIAADEARILELEAKLLRLQRELPGLEEEFLRGELLESKDAGKLKAKFEESKKQADEVERKIRRIKRNVTLMNEGSRQDEELALRDLREYFFAATAPLVSELVKKLRAVSEIEEKIIQLRGESEQKLATVTFYPRIVFPHIPIILLERQHRRSVCLTPFEDSRLRYILEDLEREGFSIDVEG